MALISKIRKNSWLLIVLIGLGLGGFIIMDMTSGQQSVFGSSQFTVGEIDGQKLDWNQFNRVEQVLYGNSG
ncbi:MAG: SurA N-terminal domain-containing protein, partial [Phaeodactylibacter sp.]|nr:SurA N-terminal domain-containing protein [Phaeodactylibacter sp.]